MTAEAETADLGVLLEELKGRSGLSYGTLAKRLHMSASTLHRYCKGDGLPPEFATVERFARLCRATPEELMELHRRWIAADTARERQRERRAPESEPPAVAPPAPQPPASTPTPPPPPPARRRGRTVLLVGAAALAVALTVTGAVWLASSGDDASDAGDSGDTTADAGAGGDGEPAPVTVAARPHAFQEDSPCGNWYLVDAEPEQVPPPPDEAAAPGWAAAMGAVSADEQYVELTIQSTGDETVVLRELRVRVSRAEDPLPWNLFTGYGACGGGPVETTAFDIDLDAAAPEPTAAGDQPELPLWVDETDPLVVYITASTEAHDVDWFLELDWASGDREGVLRIDDEGQPFRTSATEGQPGWSFPIGGTEWYTHDTE
ncbi:helix-turn-helix domain-containing protein [Streptomyces hainanensis]|uniref:XRE family transcriptional regulator n=1 Tax=Streptomyces hainanensis TaxID=402648 RepID=A0A4R4T8P8_9ACTN|nr:helix-turn-helix transcriptional regulator [Streptomyces hainanensis]TDC73417.1 XRE family transcriptional regulator [Streptomyces hainanensis]